MQRARKANLESPIGLLISVRSADEARVALAGGATLIDIKEPAHGALGRASANTIDSIVAAVNGATPVSAAMGEWLEDSGELSREGLSFIKWGLAGCGQREDWRNALRALLARGQEPQLVLTAYADWECAQAPPVHEVFALAAEQAGSVLLVDTHCKDATTVGKRKPTLLDWLSVGDIEDLCQRCRDAEVGIALAGSLGSAEIRALQFARPNWFAVRGAVCADGDRQGTIDADKVAALLSEIRSFSQETIPAG